MSLKSFNNYTPPYAWLNKDLNSDGKLQITYAIRPRHILKYYGKIWNFSMENFSAFLACDFIYISRSNSHGI